MGFVHALVFPRSRAEYSLIANAHNAKITEGLYALIKNLGFILGTVVFGGSGITRGDWE